jgi:peroxiredoxin
MKKNLNRFGLGSLLFVLLAFSPQLMEIPDKPEDISPLLIGEKIPNTKIYDLENKGLNINDLIAQKPSILIFFRGGWCPFCNKQLAAIQDIKPKLEKLGYQIIAISPDKPEGMKKTLDKNQLDYTLLSDYTMEASLALGIAFKSSKYQDLLEKSSGQKHHLLPVPAVFIVDQTGKILFEYINPNYQERLNPKLLLVAAELALEK